MTITTRAAKGSELSHAEMDENFTDLRDGVDIQIPKTQGKGIKIDSLGTPDWGWRDLHSPFVINAIAPNPAGFAVYRGGIGAHQFAEGEAAFAVAANAIRT